jgi:hypothetical protein
MNLLKIALLSFALTLGFTTLADNETVGEKVEEGVGDMQKSAKKTYRKAKDETCHWVKGKLECAKDKVKNKAKNVGDEVKDATDTE